MAQKILVVDDEAQIVRVVRSYLENAGYQVVTASNGQEALTLARRKSGTFTRPWLKAMAP